MSNFGGIPPKAPYIKKLILNVNNSNYDNASLFYICLSLGGIPHKDLMH